MTTHRFPTRPLLVAALVPALLLVSLMGLGTSPLARADEQAETGGAARVRLQIDEPVALDDFLRMVAKATGLQFVWNPADKNIRGKEILGGVDLEAPRAEFFPLVRSLLTFYELVTIPVGPAGSQLILVADARQTSAILKLKPEYVRLTEENLARYEGQDGLFVTTTINVEHMTDVRSARNALTRIVTGQNIGNVTEVPGTNAFVVTDFAPNVVAIYRLLKEMDQPSAGSTTTGGTTLAIALEHAVAQEVALLLSRHFAAYPGAGSTGPGRAPQPALPGPSAPRISGDERTNQVFVTGTPDQIQAVQQAIARLDIPVRKPTVLAHMIRLTHIDAQEAARVLGSLIQGAAGLWGSNPGSRPSVVSHPETNALLIAASAEDHETLRRLVEAMDAGDD